MKLSGFRKTVSVLLCAAMFGNIGALAAELGVVEVFKLSKSNLAKDLELWDNREFKQRNMEYLDRGLVAVKTTEGVFVSWRWLGTESNEVRYNLYRNGERVNAFPLNVTNYTDTAGGTDDTYTVAAVTDGEEEEQCAAVEVWGENKLEIPLTDKPQAVNPDGSQKLAEDGTEVYYEPTETSIADLDGDGQYEIILKWDPSDRCDNSLDGITSPLILDAYKLDGTRMWRINLGYNIRTGSHYTQFMVYDFDGDGKAEMICKTADGTTDNEGNVVGNANKLWRNSGTGRILDGPEYLTAFDGETGTVLDTVDYIPDRGTVSDWGDDYGNRVDRFLACVAYLDGEHPSVVMCRGYYTRMVLAAWDLKDKKLRHRWTFDTDNNHGDFMGQGNHSVTAADVDMDTKDEIVYGGAVIDDDGTGLYSTGLGHGDAQHTGDLVPDHPGLEIFSVHEESDAKYGVEMRDARTGEFLWGSYENTDVGRGVSDDIDPNYYGCESWSSQKKMISAHGEVIYENPSISYNFLAYWDGDLGRELQDGNHIDKWVPEKKKTKVLFSPKGYVSNNGSKASPGITCDLFGDWREETILFKEDDSSMAIFTTTEPTDYKIYTLMHDLQYRTYIATQNVGYNQPPHLGYYLGFDTTEIPVSRVKVTHDGVTETNPDLDGGTKYYSLESLKRDNGTTLVIDSPFADVDGTITRIDAENRDVKPFIENERTMVPMRFIAEACGAEVDWNADKRLVTIKKDNKTVKLTIGEKTLKVGSKSIELDTPAEIVNDTTFVPIRAVAEALDKKVAWYDGVIYINDIYDTVTSEQGELLRESIENYVEPEIDTSAPTPIETTTLNEKQIPVYAVEASSDDGNIAEGAVDGSFTTRWNTFGDGEWLMLDFNETKEIAGIAASFYKSSSRQYYFDIQVSDDGITWTDAATGLESSGETEEGELEMFTFKTPVKGRYLRYLGHGSSTNDSNNLYELAALAP